MPTQCIGLLGGGQLALMLAQAGQVLGYEFCFLDPNPDSPAQREGHFICAEYSDEAALEDFCQRVDVVGFENENIPAATLAFIQQRKAIYPNPKVLEYTQDRVLEKQWFVDHAVATNAFLAIAGQAELAQAVDTLGLPLIIKTRRFGYDGKVQYLLRDATDVAQCQLPENPQGYIAEAFVDFSHEISCIAARGQQGDIVFYDITENYHAAGILRASTNRPDHPMQAQAQDYCRVLLEASHYVGLFALELFVTSTGLLANECAPRVHNSGHWTIEGSNCSQFTNHCLALAGEPLRQPQAQGYALMLNCISKHPDLAQIDASWYWHDYHKAARAQRKLGHFTRLLSSPVSSAELAKVSVE